MFSSDFALSNNRNILNSYYLCVCGSMCVPLHVCWGQKTVYGSWLSFYLVKERALLFLPFCILQASSFWRLWSLLPIISPIYRSTAHRISTSILLMWTTCWKLVVCILTNTFLNGAICGYYLSSFFIVILKSIFFQFSKTYNLLIVFNIRLEFIQNCLLDVWKLFSGILFSFCKLVNLFKLLIWIGVVKFLYLLG